MRKGDKMRDGQRKEENRRHEVRYDKWGQKNYIKKKMIEKNT